MKAAPGAVEQEAARPQRPTNVTAAPGKKSFSFEKKKDLGLLDPLNICEYFTRFAHHPRN